MRNPELWITVGNLVFLFSYSVRDILWLRTLTVVAGLLLIPYYALQSAPPYSSIAWAVVFIAINVVWIAVLAVERRPVQLDADETRLRELSFPSLTAREARQLFDTGAWEDIELGRSIVEHDNRTRRFSVILRGNADVVYHGKKVAELGPGQFLGMIDRSALAVPIDAIACEMVRIKCWSRDRLAAFLATRPDVALALQRSVGLEVQRLLHEALSQLDKAK